MRLIKFNETCLGIVGAVSATVFGHFPSDGQPLTVVKMVRQPDWLLPHGCAILVAFGVTTSPTGSMAAVRVIVETTGNQSVRDCQDSAISQVCLSCWSAAAMTLQQMKRTFIEKNLFKKVWQEQYAKVNNKCNRKAINTL